MQSISGICCPVLFSRPASRGWFRPAALFAALALCLLVSSRGADAELKSEWKFGGSFAGALMSIPFASAVFNDMSSFDEPYLPSAAQPASGSLGELFSRRGLVGGFAAGFLGAGVFGLMFGHGVYGELSGVPSAFGLVLQLALFLLLARLIFSWWRDDRAGTALSPRQLADAYGRLRHGTLPDVEPDAGEKS